MFDYILNITGLNGMIARRDEEGASAVEYGLLVAGIAALIVAVVFVFGGMISDVFTDTCGTIRRHCANGGCRHRLHPVIKAFTKTRWSSRRAPPGQPHSCRQTPSSLHLGGTAC